MESDFGRFVDVMVEHIISHICCMFVPILSICIKMQLNIQAEILHKLVVCTVFVSACCV